MTVVQSATKRSADDRNTSFIGMLLFFVKATIPVIMSTTNPAVVKRCVGVHATTSTKP
jgi:hypothetical protein